MKKTQDIKIEDYNYDLPDEKIAKFPLKNRDQSKLLIWKKGAISESCFNTLPDYLDKNSLIIFNNTKVIQARMHFQKSTGALIEIFCLEPVMPHDYQLILQSNQDCTWLCMIGNLKKWKEGKLFKTIRVKETKVIIHAEKIVTRGNSHVVRFSWDNPDITFADILESGGELPIPPYLNRKTEDADKETYQTVYSKIKGSVAAPTAGLHFTPEVIQKLTDKGIVCDELTLHVGAGTFLPVKSDLIKDHEMHMEFFSVSKSLIESLITHLDHIIAVGTTSVRTLESLYYVGVLLDRNPSIESDKLIVTQWQAYESEINISTEKALKNIITYLDTNNLDKLMTTTRIMIAPGYSFKIVKGIITNFHQPKSTLLLLVSAFVDGKWKEIYDYAASHDFRYLSYGDSSLLLP